jgi:hypothetical protein
MKKLSKEELLKLYVPKFKASGYRSFWVDSYFRKANEWYPDKNVEYWANELLQSPKAMLWLTKNDIDEAVNWNKYCDWKEYCKSLGIVED